VIVATVGRGPAVSTDRLDSPIARGGLELVTGACSLANTAAHVPRLAPVPRNTPHAYAEAVALQRAATPVVFTFGCHALWLVPPDMHATHVRG
jgi:hypothetical protein